MKNIMKAVVVVFVAMLMLSSTIGVANAVPEYVVNLSVGNPPNPGKLNWEGFPAFKEEVERLSEGRMEVKLYPGGQLGDFASVAKQIREGIIEAGEVPDGFVASMFPEIQVFSIPYLFVDYDVAYRVLDGPVAMELMDLMAEKTGLRVFRIAENGFRHFSNSKQEIRTPEDMKGLKIRTMSIPAHMQIVKDLGANPVPIAWQELYTALQTGVVDGQENAFYLVPIAKLDEVQKYIIADGHVYGTGMMIFNDEWYQGLPDDLKDVVQKAAQKSVEVNRSYSKSNNEEAVEYLKSKGIQIYFPTPEEKEQFRVLTQESGINWLRGEIGDEWVDKILAEVERVEKELGYK
jgi:C4-dicarboxylate-binding protein DctP